MTAPEPHRASHLRDAAIDAATKALLDHWCETGRCVDRDHYEPTARADATTVLDAADAALRDIADPSDYRTGRKLGRTIYRDDILIGVMDTPELGALVVAALNAHDPAPCACEHHKEIPDG